MVAAVALVAALQAGAGKVQAQTSVFKTQHYTIAVTTHCREDEMFCDNVTYKSLSTTGKSITLRGRENMRLCPDGKTPCGSLGFSFMNGDVEYHVPQIDIDGDLIVRRGRNSLLTEPGQWTDPQ